MGEASYKSATEVVRDGFGPLAGLPCWNVKHGFGSFLTFEFGKSELELKEAIPNSKSKIRSNNRAYLHGQYHLWIKQCEWEISAGAGQIAHSESAKSIIADTTTNLAGQRLVQLSVNGRKRTSVFKFERRHSLKVFPYEDVPENLALWQLYTPNKVLSYLDTGMLEYGPANERSATLANCNDIEFEIASG